MKKFHIEYVLKSGFTVIGKPFECSSMEEADSGVWSLMNKMKPESPFDVECFDGCQRMFFCGEISYLTIVEE
jgi:hypothetical protein